MEFSQDQQVKAGIFVVIGLVIISLSILLLGDDANVFTSSYNLRIRFKQVQGLTEGSQVNLAGLKVGSIRRIEFATDSQELVAVVEIESRFKPRITDGTTASVKTLGALGDKYIYLTPGERQNAPLAENSFIPAEDGGDIFDMISKKGNELGSIVEVVGELNLLLKNLNHDGRTAKLIDSFSAAAFELKQLSRQTRESLDQKKLHDVIDRLASIMGKIDRGDGTLGALINDPTLHQKLTTLLGESDRRQYLKPLIRESIIHQERGHKEVR